MKTKKYNLKIMIIAVMGFFVLSNIIFVKPSHALLTGISVSDAYGNTLLQQLAQWFPAKDAKDKSWQTAASKALQAAIRHFLNTIAYDTATWIGSGNKGQKPMFITEGWGTYLSNTADNAAGTFLEQLGKNNPWTRFNVCEPNLSVKLQIGLGLVQYQRPQAPSCTFTKAVQKWKSEADRIKAMRRSDYLQTFQTMFDPASNDVSIALTLQTGMMEAKRAAGQVKTNERTVNQGWLNQVDVAGNLRSYPGYSQDRLSTVNMFQANNAVKVTGDLFADAVNVFLNQVAISAFNNLMQHLGENKANYTSPYSGNWGGLADPLADVGTSATDVAQSASKILEPSFAVRADYNVLADLVSCPDPSKAGPSNCVITDKFSQAISDRMTVGDAMKQGYLNKGGVFGFKEDNSELKYADESYPYRSMIILRKYRIIPVGWELAAQYIKQNAVNGAKNFTLGDMVACFDPYDEYKGYGDDCVLGIESSCWCKGLVDPNWVLKAPLEYCRRQGYGPEIVTQQVVGEEDDSKVVISRNGNYCGDEQSCIKENDDGSCNAYGYCSKEVRAWDFNTKSCDAEYNTCQTFKNEAGKTISYLENTLDYANCNADNAGCAAYATVYDYATKRWQPTGAKIYMDSGAEKCSSSNEGCRELIRVKDGIGANLIPNSSFEDALAGTLGAGGTQAADAYSGTYSLALSGSLSANITVAPSTYSIGGEQYSLSFYAKNCGSTGTFGINGSTATLSSDAGGWTRQTISYTYPSSASGNIVAISINPPVASCLIDAIKLERGAKPTAYSDYATDGVVYEKLMPNYLSTGNICYDAAGNLQPNAPKECQNFARRCTASEVNCNLYTSAVDGISVPAKTVAQDHCPSECVGYDTYVQGDTYFDTARPNYFIPSTAQSCSADAVGCEEFTNLDRVSKGGEGLEFYSYLRQCMKPSGASCGTYYVWEGSDETGYQLKVMSMETGSNGPFVTDAAADAAGCNATIYGLAPTDPSYNSDCRQFYDSSGNISYHLLSLTVDCSDNCLAYRETRHNTDPAITSAGACTGTDKHWDAAAGECVVCKNNGVWDNDHNGCIYMGMPGMGRTCAAASNGCREYSGNTGSNMRVVVNSDFEGSTQGWSGAGATVSNNALLVGGHSLSISGSASVVVGNGVSQNKSYILTFIAQGNGGTSNITANISNGAGLTTAFSGSASSLDGQWQKFQLSMGSLASVVSASEQLTISGSGAFYIDDVRLVEITDRYYLIRDSWNTPATCDQDTDGNPYPLFALGCQVYTDNNQEAAYLHSFSNLCAESAVGCELLIDTQNSDFYGTGSTTVGSSTIATPADNYIYAVFDTKKQCGATDKGCQRLGKPYDYDGATVYRDVYLRNNPDTYSTSMCDMSAVNCNQWTMDNGNAYFKDPGDQICEYRRPANSNLGSGWYRKKIKHCTAGITGSVCLEDVDCTPVTSTTTPKGACVADATDTPCIVSTTKTFGTGGVAVEQPVRSGATNWAGVCPASQSSCTEYIDPISKFSSNEVISKTGYPTPIVELSPNTLYALSNGHIYGCADAKTGAGFSQLYVLGADNNLGAAAGSVSLAGMSVRFLVGNNSNNIICNADNGTTVRQAVVNYQLMSGIDYKTCNGMVDFEKGCVLFDERALDGASGYVNLTGYYDADLTINDGLGALPISNTTPAYNNANKVVKVSPDRKCDEWLACEESRNDVSTDANVCVKIGVCNKADDKGGCERFVRDSTNVPIDQTFDPNGPSINADYISNLSGYVKVGHTALNTTPSGAKNKVSFYPNDYYQFEVASTTGGLANVPNGGFELVKNNAGIATDTVVSNMKVNGASSTVAFDQYTPNKPHYIPGGTPGNTANETWTCSNPQMCSVMNNPTAIQLANACFVGDKDTCSVYAPEGRNFLKVDVNPSNITSVYTSPGQEINVTGGEPYILTAYLNTQSLSDGKAIIQIEEYGTLNTTAQGQINLFVTKSNYTILEFDKGEPWTFVMANFATMANTTNIKITITAEPDAGLYPNGAFYADGISIVSALHSRDNWYTPQTCRIYPAQDSLTCDYFESSGIRRKGWSGYCLEYDQAPGNPDACLMWWPVPNTTYKAQSVCGDGFVSGTSEQCDCLPLNNATQSSPGTFQSSCSASDFTTTNPLVPPYPYTIFGTTPDNQYKCVGCRWTDGYCGDGTLQEPNYHEHCEFQYTAGTRNMALNNTECWYDHNAGNLQDNAYRDFTHPDPNAGPYYDYLYGTLGCNNNSKSAQPNPYFPTQQRLRQNCTYDDEGTCHDELYQGHHTRKQCIDAGGVVVSDGPDYNTGGVMTRNVTDGGGYILDHTVNGNNNLNYFCKFPVNIPGGDNNSPALTCQGRAGWDVYYSNGATLPWTSTSQQSCTGSACDGANTCDSGLGWCFCTPIYVRTETRTAGNHNSFTNVTPIESTGFVNGCNCDCGSCWNSGHTCYANITAIGCY